MTLTIEALKAGELASVLGALAELRINVFRDFPYLYDGSLDYEHNYLSRFSKAHGAVIVVARDGGRIVGAATGAPMMEVEPEFSAPFLAHGYDIDNLFYCAESVLLSDYRGQGIGHAFFDHREQHARSLGADRSCFCAVIRSDDDPRKPVGYSPLDPFWRKRGYAPLEGVQASFAWKDVGDAEETEKPLQFWLRELY